MACVTDVGSVKQVSILPDTEELVLILYLPRLLLKLKLAGSFGSFCVMGVIAVIYHNISIIDSVTYRGG